MSHEDNITKIKLCYTLWKNGISPEAIPAQLGVHRSTVYRWIRGFQRIGIREFERRYKAAKKGRKQPRKTTVLAKVRILKIRKGNQPREVIQTDTVDFGNIYAFTAIDTYTKEASVIIRPQLTSTDGKHALTQQLDNFGKIDHIQRDGGSEFKGKWQEYAVKHIPSIRTARPYKKNEQAYIERFNGILRKECLGHAKYRKKDLHKVQQAVNRFLDYYHTKRPHLSLNMQTPSEFAAAHAASMSHLT